MIARVLSFFFSTLLLLPAAHPLGVFDFDLRGANPPEQIHSLDGIGFDGITMWMNSPQDLAKFKAYRVAVPATRLIAGLVILKADKPDGINFDHLRNVARELAGMNGKLWLIVGGDKKDTDSIVKLIRKVADIAAAEKIGVSIYPHDNQAIETAEEALVFLKKAERDNLTISVHQCHELRAGNIDRLDAVVKAVLPYMDLVTVCGSDRKTNDNSKDWSDAIKPFGEGDFDPKIFLRVLERNQFKGQVILHTFGLQKKPADHYRKSFELYQQMWKEIEAEKP